MQLYWVALKSIWAKEIHRFMRIWIQTLVPPVITMTLYFVIFGNLIGSRIGEMHGFTYMQFIVPGLIMMAVITNAYANVASSFFSAKFQRNIEELLVAPVPTHVVIAGYVGGGVARGLCVGILVTAISLFFVPFQVHSWLFVGLTLMLTAVLFSLAGLLNAVFAKTFDDISLILEASRHVPAPDRAGMREVPLCLHDVSRRGSRGRSCRCRSARDTTRCIRTGGRRW